MKGRVVSGRGKQPARLKVREVQKTEFWEQKKGREHEAER